MKVVIINYAIDGKWNGNDLETKWNYLRN